MITIVEVKEDSAGNPVVEDICLSSCPRPHLIVWHYVGGSANAAVTWGFNWVKGQEPPPGIFSNFMAIDDTPWAVISDKYNGTGGPWPYNLTVSTSPGEKKKPVRGSSPGGGGNPNIKNN